MAYRKPSGFQEVLPSRKWRKTPIDFFSEPINYIDFFLCAHILWPGKEFGGFFSIYSTGGGEARYQL
jgi:hypothetical protein